MCISLLFVCTYVAGFLTNLAQVYIYDQQVLLSFNPSDEYPEI